MTGFFIGIKTPSGFTAGPRKKPSAASRLKSCALHPAEFQKAKSSVLHDRQWQGEFNHHDHHGGELVVAARWTLVHDSLGKPDSILAISTDITRQKILEAQFLRAQRLDSIGVLAGGIAHDLNNVLAPILMSAQLLEMDPDAPDRREIDHEHSHQHPARRRPGQANPHVRPRHGGTPRSRAAAPTAGGSAETF